MAVNGGEMRHEDYARTLAPFLDILSWIDKCTLVNSTPDNMKRKSDVIAGEESGSSLQTKKVKGIESICIKLVLVRSSN